MSYPKLLSSHAPNLRRSVVNQAGGGSTSWTVPRPGYNVSLSPTPSPNSTILRLAKKKKNIKHHTFTMAPFVPQSRAPAVTATPFGDDPPETHHPNRMAWVIPVIVSSTLVIIALVVCGFIYYNKRGEFRRAKEQDPYLTRSDFSRRKNMSALERKEEEERQRLSMIQKSLASRSWDCGESNSSRRVSQISNDSQSTRAGDQGGDVSDDEPKQLKDDWKEYEARMQRSTSLEHHPAIVPKPAPFPPRSQSPSRSPLLHQRQDVP